jgi:hypothetical protein
MRGLQIATVAVGFIAHCEAFSIGASAPAPAVARHSATRMMFGGGGDDKEGGGFMYAHAQKSRTPSVFFLGSTLSHLVEGSMLC